MSTGTVCWQLFCFVKMWLHSEIRWIDDRSRSKSETSLWCSYAAQGYMHFWKLPKEYDQQFYIMKPNEIYSELLYSWPPVNDKRIILYMKCMNVYNVKIVNISSKFLSGNFRYTRNKVVVTNSNDNIKCSKPIALFYRFD